MAPVTALLIGAGQRGRYVYAEHALRHPDDLRLVAVAESLPERRAVVANGHGIPAANRFPTWEDALGGERVADAVIVATHDRDHHAPVLAALEAGYDVLVEKPLAADLPTSVAVVAAALRSGRVVHVAHVLRYTPFFGTLNEIVTSGRLGDIVTVEHRENVAYWHMAHTFVRGLSARRAEGSPMIVQKCCHDLDLLQWNLAPVRRLSSIGSLMHFRPEHAPAGAPPRCTDGCPAADACPFEARRIYLNMEWTGWPVHVITDDLSRAGREHALETGPYGRCVYTAGSDVVDHQTVSMELTTGASVTLVMHGHAAEEARTMRYDGTRATLRGVFGREKHIEIRDHGSGRREEIPVEDATGGHGGGDPVMIAAFVAAVRDGRPSPTDAAASLESHLLAFAAEEARLSGDVIDMASFRREHGADLQGPAS